ncbi:StbD family antitoxin [Isoalcanivorax pacificus W11-5]|uniref:Antitoxin n=1 Tax=Isoalcanivorax pacificus W11-5 TaxID=391936 RepID=A0A0B4XHS8_9GAMM|nr:type II toxin-antitoxin system Phd/YefM family antitoxin [Isoalcanivorax pacificus]AJD46621.1 StbD family antitoxin [Isoalcanivorax pacificus W11-5]
MADFRIDEDIRSLSEFRAGVAGFVKQVQETGRPLVLTQHGRGVAVLLGAHEFAAMQERLALLEDIYRAEQDIAAGKGVAHEEARRRLLGK